MLIDSISESIQNNGPMPFVEFMHQALYNPDFGYYNSSLTKLGAEGDFITAPELSPLFGQTIANQCQPVLQQLNKPILFEFGAGSGQLCVDLLSRLERLQCLPEQYQILEVSGDLRRRQEESIQQKIPHLAHRVHWLSRWPDEPFEGVIIANEVLDAMPVHRFLLTEESLLESYVSLNAKGELQEIFQPCTNEQLIKHVSKILPKEYSPYQSEANLFIEGWLQACSTMMRRGVVLLIDYGFPEREYYHPDRHMGTLMCHHQHTSHTDPLLNPGEQDITAHVDFTHVAECALLAGFHVAGFTNQASFLLNNGLLDLTNPLSLTPNTPIPKGEGVLDKPHPCDRVSHPWLERSKTPSPLGIGSFRENQSAAWTTQITMNQAIKKLTHPHEMGELFKVMALSKSIDIELQGFRQHDKRVNL